MKFQQEAYQNMLHIYAASHAA